MTYTELHPTDLNWCVRRLPKQVRTSLKGDSTMFVAGGFIRSCIANEKVNDVDLFVPSVADAERQARILTGNDDTRIYRTDNALTLRGIRPTVQIIHRWTFDRPEDCIRSFDFTIASAAIWFDATHNVWLSVCHANFYADLAAKRLVYMAPDRDEEPGGSMLRVLKFYQRGYRIPLDSLGAVIARLSKDMPATAFDERRVARVLTSRLVQVDPAEDISHEAHLPAATAASADDDGELDPIF